MAKIDRHYQDELSRLHDMAAEYAQFNPSQAGHLAAVGRDPDVERILEGVAFLTAGLREELEKDQTQLLQNILQVASPDLLRPVPSVTLMEFKGRPALKEHLKLPVNTPVAGISSSGQRCEFRTLLSTTVLPVDLKDAVFRKSQEQEAGAYCLSVTLSCRIGDYSELAGQGLSLYLNAPQSGAAKMLNALLGHVESGVLDIAGEQYELSAPQWNTELLQWPFIRGDAPDLPAHRMMQRFFLSPELAQGVRIELPGGQNALNLSAQTLFSTVSDRASQANEFTLRFYFDAGADWPKADLKKTIRLNVVPAANLFVRDAPPRVRDNRQTYMPLSPRQRDNETLSVYGIEQVFGQYRSQPDEHLYQPFWQQGGGDVFNYQEQLSADPVTDELQLSVALGGVVKDEQEVIKARLYCSNGSDASGLLPGEVTEHVSGSPELVDFANLTTPSPYRRSVPAEQQYWQAVRQLSGNLMGHLTLHRLQATLKELVLQGSPDRARHQVNMKKVEAIQQVDLRMTDRLVSAMSVRGYEVDLVLAGDHFTGKADMQMFARLLQQFFISLVPVNYFCLLKVTDIQTGETDVWPPMLGREPLL